jgi:hypothetical protein
VRTLCCKKKEYSLEDGEYHYYFTGGIDNE